MSDADLTTDRQVERGIKQFHCHGECLIVFEAAFFWGLAVRLCDWSKIIVLEHDFVRAASCPLSIAAFQKIGEKLLAVPLEEIMTYLPRVTCLLASGSAKFLTRFFEKGKIFDPANLEGQLLSGLLVCTDSSRRAPDVTPFQWNSLRHSRVGGATTKRVWLASLSLKDTIVVPQAVLRTIGNIIDHGIRPDPSKPTPLSTHYIPSDRLLISEAGICVPVVYPTHFTFTGYGSRALTFSELALSLDLPVWVAKNDDLMRQVVESKTLFTIVPLKFLITGLDSQLKMIRPVIRDAPVIGDSESLATSIGMKRLVLALEEERGDWISSLGIWLPPDWASQELVSDRAAKDDDALIANGMWDLRIIPLLGGNPKTLEVLRSFGNRCWNRNAYKSFCSYLQRHYGKDWVSQLATLRQQRGKKGPHDFSLLKDADAGYDVLSQVLQGEWWEWSMGSSLLFWRWSTPFQIQCARDGMPIHVSGALPRNRKPQRPIAPDLKPLYVEKLDKVRERGYIQPGRVVSLTHMFDVPKGASDIRMVYDGTSSGLNDALWAPSFWLPNTESAMRMYDYSTYCVDMDLGEMFLNFPMDPAIRPYAGVDLTQLVSDFRRARPDTFAAQ